MEKCYIIISYHVNMGWRCYKIYGTLSEIKEEIDLLRDDSRILNVMYVNVDHFLNSNKI